MAYQCCHHFLCAKPKNVRMVDYTSRYWCHDTQHHNIQHNDTQHNDTQIIQLSIMTLSLTTFSIITLGTTTFSITTFSIITLSIIDSLMTHFINDIQHGETRHNALTWASHFKLLRLVSLGWMSLWRMSWRRPWYLSSLLHLTILLIRKKLEKEQGINFDNLG